MDENYYVLRVKVRENLTDTRAVERMKAWAFYSHLSEIDVNVNDQVKEGDIIGKTGNASNFTGEDEHLHFEYRTGGAKPGRGLIGREDPNLVVDTKFEPDPNNAGKVRRVEE